MKIQIVNSEGNIMDTTANLELAVIVAKKRSGELAITHLLPEEKYLAPGKYEDTNQKATGRIICKSDYQYILTIAGSPQEAANLFDGIMKGTIHPVD